LSNVLICSLKKIFDFKNCKSVENSTTEKEFQIIFFNFSKFFKKEILFLNEIKKYFSEWKFIYH
jgi:hypothetical protein